ncbi:hypothetical protein, partial [Arhodomonas sp. KWT]
SVDGNDAQVRGLLPRLERELKRLADLGAGAEPRPDLLRDMLYVLAGVDSPGRRVRAVQQVYDLDGLRRRIARLQSEGGEGADLDALRTVAGVLREDVAAVKDSLDLHVRAGDADSERLREAADGMHRVSDTLGVLGLESQRRALAEHAETLVNGDPDDEGIMAVAEALLSV